MPENYPTITMLCKYDRYTHASVTLIDGGVVVSHGFIVRREFVEETSETLLFAEHPEISEVHDGYGWNATALVWLVDLCCEGMQ
jgi:hypothetical protein